MNNSNYLYFHRSPFTRSKVSNRSYSELSAAVTDISFVSSGMPSTDRTTASFDSQEINIVPRLSNSSDTDGRLSFGSPFSGSRSSDPNSSFGIFSSSSLESGNFSWSGSQNLVCISKTKYEIYKLKIVGPRKDMKT